MSSSYLGESDELRVMSAEFRILSPGSGVLSPQKNLALQDIFMLEDVAKG
jgi:hypothetical protein